MRQDNKTLRRGI